MISNNFSAQVQRQYPESDSSSSSFCSQSDLKANKLRDFFINFGMLKISLETLGKHFPNMKSSVNSAILPRAYSFAACTAGSIVLASALSRIADSFDDRKKTSKLSSLETYSGLFLMNLHVFSNYKLSLNFSPLRVEIPGKFLLGLTIYSNVIAIREVYAFAISALSKMKEQGLKKEAVN